MDSPERRRSTGFDRRRSLRSPTTRYSMQQNEADDEYDLEAMGISDGFRPGGDASPARGHHRISSRISQHEQTPGRRSTPPPRPSSTTKPRYTSFTLQHDGATNASAPLGPAAMGSTSSAALLSRTSSTSTITPYVRPESPYEGPSAPSHPYQMYPQDAARLARTASVATTSTYRPPSLRSYAGPGGPTHPYAMYPQNTVTEADEPHVLPAATIPVGFPGRNNEYQRRLGPEGEEAADLIGPDGHTEQLPPYSQYPEEAFAQKAAALLPVVAEGNSGSSSTSQNPESMSRENLVNPFESPIDRMETSDSDNQASTGAAGATEKPVEKKWKTIAKRKICGIVPVWVLVILVIVILIFAIIVGVAVAVVKAKMRGGPPPPKPTTTSQNEYATTITATHDATPLATAPPNLPSIQTGVWSLNIGNSQTASSNCIASSALLGAWSCNVPPNMLQMTVQSMSSSDNLRNYKISTAQSNGSMPNPSAPPQYFYGAQPPIVSDEHSMQLVNDSNAARYGPAWFFKIEYDKLVVVPEPILTPPTKRDGLAMRTPGSAKYEVNFNPVRKGLAQPSERPWFCYWNNTILETFIYPNATSSSGASSVVSSSSVASATPSSYILKNIYPPYPKVVRVEERRFPNQVVKPYCQKMLVLDNGVVAPYIDPTTNRNVTFELDEAAATYVQSGASKRSDSLQSRDDKSDSTCNCVWLAS